MSDNQEKIPAGSERTVENRQSAGNRLEELSKNLEKHGELSPRDIEDLETRAQKAREVAVETAISVDTETKEKKESAPSRRGPINKKQLNKSYKQTMRRVQNELPIGSRIFSKVIHNNVVEKTSEIVGNTVARPNAILVGAFMAFVLPLATYTIAKTIGYPLSGFETIAAFIIGWIIGIVYDYLRVLFTGKSS